MNRLRILIGLGLSAALLGCGDQRVAGGNSSETPNTLTGILYDTLGKPRAGDTVTLRPARWTADDLPPAGARAANVWTTVTDSSGRWNVVGMESGAWVVESRKGDEGRLCATVTVGEERPFVALQADTVYRLRTIEGGFGPGMFPKGARGRVSIYGTDIQTGIDSTGKFVIKGVPVGDLRLVAQIESDSVGQSRAEDALALPPRDSIAPRVLLASSFQGEDYDLWPNRRSATLRFSGVGGFTLESMIDTIPILVHLSGAPVSPDDRTGSSIRFADAGGAHLPYEIERWDPVKREADVWVLMRSVRKRSDAHSIMVYWGLPDVPDWSNGAAVFDTARGWVGVWHFSGGDPMRDVTANRLRLSGSGWTSVKGIAGDGIRLSMVSRLSVPGDLMIGNGRATVSGWILPDTVGVVGEVLRLVASGTDSSAWSLRFGDTAGAWRASFRTPAQGSAAFPEGSTRSMCKNVWAHLGGILDASRSSPRIRVLVDSGMVADQRYDSVKIAADRAVVQVGGGWEGVIDEVRLRRNVVHPDALRLEWGTGRLEATVVWWGE